MIQKAYETELNEIIFRSKDDIIEEYELPIEIREFTSDEIAYPKISNGKIIVDIDKKTAAENQMKIDKAEQVRQEIISELDNSEKKVSPHPKYPADVPQWKTFREQLWSDLDSLKIMTLEQLSNYVVPDRPFRKE